MKILYLVTEDWYFCSHRLPLAKAAISRGNEVVVATRVQDLGELMAQQGIRIRPLRLRRRGANPINEFKALMEIRRIYADVKPDIVHHVSLKPVLYGSLAAMFSGQPKVVNAIAGLGFVFASKRLLARLLRPIVKVSFRYLFNRQDTRVIVQNPDDEALLVQSIGVKRSHVKLIRGAGVNVLAFKAVPEPSGVVELALVSRMLWDKGVGEYIEAVKLLTAKGLRFKALLVGQPDDDNPTAVSREQLEQWQVQGYIEWLGHVNDIAGVWAAAHVAVLPSYYGEGVPKSLLEAASCGRPIVTTDMPGCREIVKHEVNGLLVPARDAEALAAALAKLISNAQLRKSMGNKGREIVEQEFSEQKVIAETLAIYDQLVQ